MIPKLSASQLPDSACPRLFGTTPIHVLHAAATNRRIPSTQSQAKIRAVRSAILQTPFLQPHNRHLISPEPIQQPSAPSCLPSDEPSRSEPNQKQIRHVICGSAPSSPPRLKSRPTEKEDPTPPHVDRGGRGGWFRFRLLCGFGEGVTDGGGVVRWRENLAFRDTD